MKKICPACQQECSRLHEIVIGGYVRIQVCAKCKRAHLVHMREVARKAAAS